MSAWCAHHWDSDPTAQDLSAEMLTLPNATQEPVTEGSQGHGHVMVLLGSLARP